MITLFLFLPFLKRNKGKVFDNDSNRGNDTHCYFNAYYETPASSSALRVLPDNENIAASAFGNDDGIGKEYCIIWSLIFWIMSNLLGMEFRYQIDKNTVNDCEEELGRLFTIDEEEEDDTPSYVF